MYNVVWVKDGTKQHTVLKTNIKTLKEANAARWASGDLVVYAGTLDVITDDEWLWDWEKKNPGSYAYRKVMKAKKVPLLSI